MADNPVYKVIKATRADNMQDQLNDADAQGYVLEPGTFSVARSESGDVMYFCVMQLVNSKDDWPGEAFAPS